MTARGGVPTPPKLGNGGTASATYTIASKGTRPCIWYTLGFVPLPEMVGYGATVWDLLPIYPRRITEHGALGGPTYPPRITEHGAPGIPTYPPRITEHGGGNQRNYSGNQVE